MILFGLEEFAARRRKAQEELEEILNPEVKSALAAGDWDELIEAVERLWEMTYEEESGETAPAFPAGLASKIKDNLDKTDESGEVTQARIATWLATLILSSATVAAAQADEEELFLEWVSMSDGAVRAAHKDVHGQVRPIGEKFDVAGTEMEMPGDVSAPIELWINCRCTVRPVLASEFSTSAITSEKITAAIEPEEPSMVDNDEVKADTLVPFYSVLAPEGQWSGDKRMFAEGALRNRDVPLPLTWQKNSADGHGGNVTVAKMERIAVVDGQQRAVGYFLNIPEADEVIGLIAEFGRFGVSVDADDATYEFDEAEEGVVFSDARTCSACIVAIPAFAEAYVALGLPPEGFMPEDEVEVSEDMEEAEKVLEAATITAADVAPGVTEDGPGWLTHPVDTDRLRDYWTKGAGAAKINWGTPGDFNRCRVNLAEHIKPQYLNGYCANRHKDALGFWPGEHHSATKESLAAASVVVSFNADAVAFRASTLTPKAPSAWFQNPDLTEITHLTVTEEGRVFGHVADWTKCHGLFADQCVLPPRSQTNYAHYANGQTLTDKGMVATGRITVGGAHAHGRLGLRPAQSHYEETSAAVADVVVGEDDHGIWVAGWVRPGATPEQIIALRASDVSGDWRMSGGNLEMIAVLAVNHGGYSVPRVAASLQNGSQVSLTGAGLIRAAKQDAVPKGMDIRAIAAAVAEEIEDRAKRREKMAALAASLSEGDV